jgi:hypothetical protein
MPTAVGSNTKKVNTMDSKENFYQVILAYYDKIAKGLVPEELLSGLAKSIADFYYDQYYRFKNQYPKSIKRYSSFQTKDLDHPTTFELVIKYFKERLGANYAEFSGLLLCMTDDELKAFEKNREDFYKIF